jgi:hypothetical protein
MNDPKFPILGATTPRMLGRVSIMERIWNDLTKVTPSNLSIIGPRFVGKSVIMHAIAQRAANEASPYSFVLHWHLGHVSPVSDEEFIAQLCELLRECLSKAESDMSEYRSYLEDHSFSNLSEVTDAFDDEELPILMLWDGFDKPLGQGMLTRHLWDQMRTLFYGKRHKIVTATRRPLNELIRSEDAITSPFWNIFDMNPVRITAFDEQDREAVLGELSANRFEAGAVTELVNWSSGFPPLFLELLNQIISDVPSGPVDNASVNKAADKAIEKLSSVIADMWQDCPEGAKDLYCYLIDRGEILNSDADRHEAACLLEKGFAGQQGNKLTVGCRMLQQHISGTEQNTGSMARLFGSWDNYQTNIRSLLERRLAHISRFDDRLYRLVEGAIADIPDYPDACLYNLTGIRDRALQIIWESEFGTERRIIQDIIAYWTATPRSQHKLIQDMMNSNCWDLPTDPLDQIRLLSLLTGSYRNFDSKAKAVSKDTYILINAIHNFRNRAQHPDGQSIHLGVAVAAIMTCLELLGCLERELGR